MAYESLRDYLSFLEDRGALARVLGPVSPRHEIRPGDVVAYCAGPDATVRAIGAAAIKVVTGNVEEARSNDAADRGCDFLVSCNDLDIRLVPLGWYSFTLRWGL